MKWKVKSEKWKGKTLYEVGKLKPNVINVAMARTSLLYTFHFSLFT